MNEKSQDQLELFSDSTEKQKSSYRKDNLRRNSRNIYSYERAILILIALMVVSIIAFSLGVKKGRSLQVVTLEKSPIEYPKEVGGASFVTEESLKESLKEPAKEELTFDIPSKEAYTIQVASFKTLSNTKREAELLKQRGYDSTVINKGKHIILCVGNLSNKKEAQALLSELRRYYKDCLIRRL
ncbi:MAG: SPOR domain-containing protein [Candidatus Omnitrophota bacterium]